MTENSRHAMELIQDTISSVLDPVGFKRHKLSWRRHNSEVLQQFSLFNMQLNARYRPEWGMNLRRISDDPRPQCWKLQIRWILEMTVRNLQERLGYMECFKFEKPLPHSLTAPRVAKLLKKYVVPCFESFTSEESIRRMCADKRYPMRAQSFVRLPEDWFPPIEDG